MNTLRSLVAVPVTVLALAGLSACGSSTSDSADEPTAEQTSSQSPDAASDESATTSDQAVALTADGSLAGKCAVPNADTLAGFDTAFAGTVTSLADGTATLAVDQWYAGGDAATVTVDAPSKDLQDLLMAVDFQEGQSYLVSADGGRVTLCGFTAQETPELQSLYDQAFAG